MASKKRMTYKGTKWYNTMERIYTRMKVKRKIDDANVDRAYEKGMLQKAARDRIKAKKED